MLISWLIYFQKVIPKKENAKCDGFELVNSEEENKNIPFSIYTRRAFRCKPHGHVDILISSFLSQQKEIRNENNVNIVLANTNKMHGKAAIRAK